MKLFWREQALLIFIYLVQIAIITLVYWLDGFRTANTAIYAALLSGSILALYLAYRYITNRSFYRRLSQPSASLEPLKSGASEYAIQHTPLAEALQELERHQYRAYQTELLRHQHKNEEHTQFMNQWVHQMKTPIAVMHLLIQDEDDSRSSAIGDELDRLRKGLETVLYTSRLERFEHDLHVESLSLEELVRRTVSSQKRLFIRNSVFPEIAIDASIRVVSDDKWLSFVLVQLITNAVRYSAGKGRKISFEGYELEGKAVLSIRDEGIGIPSSDLPKVFDAYFTGENGRKYDESTGMGLYLVRQICEKLNHHAELQSAVGEGTTVTLTF
ncbi:sensor histidine kinase [Paenibacillus sp. NEAU-GSW1]|uniref:sensor histidine kinase n=1 Tax=Paenibacillus sp. NEAU-GSW1 TaxID=2682486 RepID=UPI0012E2E728|nr:sensor histidine kinase [Paenibacillus sp. NEAU-GSW1]MUT66997.1 sensor histidine kinase [Paenibacillus sp. NEAU-GSW1]